METEIPHHSGFPLYAPSFTVCHSLAMLTMSFLKYHVAWCPCWKYDRSQYRRIPLFHRDLLRKRLYRFAEQAGLSDLKLPFICVTPSYCLLQPQNLHPLKSTLSLLYINSHLWSNQCIKPSWYGRPLVFESKRPVALSGGLGSWLLWRLRCKGTPFLFYINNDLGPVRVSLATQSRLSTYEFPSTFRSRWDLVFSSSPHSYHLKIQLATSRRSQTRTSKINIQFVHRACHFRRLRYVVRPLELPTETQQYNNYLQPNTAPFHRRTCSMMNRWPSSHC